MGVGDTNTVPSRTYPAVRETRAPGLPAQIPGGIDGPVSLPSRLALPVGNRRSGGPIKGGNRGPVQYFRPSVDKQAPYYVGGWQGNSPVLRRGIAWLRGWIDNDAGLRLFQPQRDATPDWTPNASDVQSGVLSPIPVSRKFINRGGLRRTFNQDSQLFIQLPRFVIQRPAQVRRTIAQPQESSPSQPRLTRWTPAAAFGQTTRTLLMRTTNAMRMNPSDPNSGGSYGGTY